jgi:hypothetical protein
MKPCTFSSDLTGNDLLLGGTILTAGERPSKTSHSLLVFVDGPLDASPCETLTRRGSLSPENFRTVDSDPESNVGFVLNGVGWRWAHEGKALATRVSASLLAQHP